MFCEIFKNNFFTETSGRLLLDYATHIVRVSSFDWLFFRSTVYFDFKRNSENANCNFWIFLLIWNEKKKRNQIYFDLKRISEKKSKFSCLVFWSDKKDKFQKNLFFSNFGSKLKNEKRKIEKHRLKKFSYSVNYCIYFNMCLKTLQFSDVLRG